ncbi:MAG: response regulator transcription factor [Acidobacteriia bacterium]|nr:response regulator transcription factor [Terriglobia bacterium]
MSTVSSQNPENRADPPPVRLTVVAIAETIQSTPGLASLLQTDTSIPLVSCSANGELAAICKQLNPCVLIAEIALINTLNFPVLTGTDTFEGSIKLLAVVDQDDPEQSKKLLRMGFSGAIHRTAPPTVYRRALCALAGGELWASRGTMAALVRELLLVDQPRRLTVREKQILELIANGHHNRQIADLLFISHETVRWHVRTMYKKLGVRDRDHAIVIARAAKDFTPAKPAQKAISSPKMLKMPSPGK